MRNIDVASNTPQRCESSLSLCILLHLLSKPSSACTVRDAWCSQPPAIGCPDSGHREGTPLNIEPRGFSGATGQRAEPARCTHSGEGTPTSGPGDPDTCRVGALPGLDTVINALMAAKPLWKHGLISDPGRSAGTCERACGLGAAAPQSSVDTASD